MERRRERIILAVVLFAALAVRLWFALACTAVPDFSDMAFYNEVALRPGFPSDLPPGYPLFLRAIYALFGAHNYRAVFVAQALLSTATVLLVYRVARAVGDEVSGLIASGIAAAYPSFIVFNLTTMTETVSVFFVAALLAVLVSRIRESAKSTGAAAILAVGCVFRPALLFFAPGAFLSLRKRLLFAATMGAFVIPVLLFGPTFGGIVQRGSLCLYKAYNPIATGGTYVDPAGTELGRDDLPSTTYLRAAFDFVRTNKWRTLDLVHRKASLVLSRGWAVGVMRPIVGSGRNRAQLLEYAAVPIMLLGVAGMIVHHGARTKALTYLALSYLSIILVFSIFKMRYRLLIAPIAIICAALLLRNLFARRKEARAEAPDAGPVAPARRAAAPLAIIFAASLAIHVCLPLAHESPFGSPGLERIRREAIESKLGSDTPPLYPLFLRAIYRAAGENNHRAVYAVQGVLASCIVLLMYAAVARLAGPRAGLFAAGISAVYPPYVIYGLMTAPELLVVVIVCSIMAVAASGLREGRKAAALGVLAAAAILLKPPLVCLVPGLLLVTKRRRLCLLVLMLALVPYTAINTVRFGRIEPVFNVPVYRLGLAAFAGARDGWDAVAAVYANAAAVIRRDINIGPYLGPHASTGGNVHYAAIYSYTAVMILGLVALLRRYRKEHRPIVAPLVLYVALLVLFSRFSADLRIPLGPLFISYAAIMLGGA